MISNFIYSEKYSAKSSFIWNMISSIYSAFLSAILLIIITWVNGEFDAGLFSITFATAQMMFTVANFGMRNYQSSDIAKKYLFQDYFHSRTFTCLVMLFLSFAFVIYNKYDFNKATICMLFCIIKVIDAYGDVYEGLYQSYDRLDVSGKTWFIRTFASTITFIVALITTHNLLLATTIMLFTSLLMLIWFVYITKDYFNYKEGSFNPSKIMTLVIECLPLCISGFTFVYLCNAPKYAIDEYLPLNIQTYYNYIFMPSFVINTFVSSVLRASLYNLSASWHNKKYKAFIKTTGLLFAVSFAIISFVVICGYFLGCPVLSIISGLNLNDYRIQLTLLLIGGGIFTLVSILQVILTIMRHQTSVMIVYIITSIISFFCSPLLVKKFAIDGAVYAYNLSVSILFVLFAILSVAFFIRDSRKRQ